MLECQVESEPLQLQRQIQKHPLHVEALGIDSTRFQMHL